MKKPMLLACLSGALISTNIIADEMPNFEAYLGAGHYFYDNDRNLDNPTSIELGAEIPMTDALSLEAWLADFDTDVETGTGDVDGNTFANLSFSNVVQKSA